MKKKEGIHLQYLLSTIHKQNLDGSKKILLLGGLTNTQFDVLSILYHQGSFTQTEIANKLMVTKGNMTQVLKVMEREELILRKQDWKEKHISLTEKGKLLFVSSMPIIERYQDHFFKVLTDDEQQELIRLLTKLHTNK